MKERFQAIKKMDYAALLKERDELRSRFLLESAKNISAGAKNTKKTNEIKREIAWVETLISEKLYSQLTKE